MFTRGKRVILEGLLVLAAIIFPVVTKAADSYEEYIEEAWTTDVDYTGKTYYHRSELADRNLFMGIDVSWWQGIGGRKSTKTSLDWKKVHEAGIDFAIVRVASRDTADGSIYEDTCADSHIRGALKNNINVGLYIFSQALTEAEAREEARYVLDRLYEYGWEVTLPIVIDRENGSYKRMVAGKLTREQETNVCLAFSKVITNAGYTPMVYANANWICKYCDLEKLEKHGCKIWLARWSEGSDQPVDKLAYEDIAAIDYDIWQYSDSGRVPGCSDRLDLDFWYMDANVPTKKLEMTANTANSVSLGWRPVEGARDYCVYRYDEELDKYVAVQNTVGTSYVDTGLTAGGTYQYKVRCRWNVGGDDYYGKYSSALTAVTLPNQVTEVAAESQSENSISLSWEEVYGADGYRIYQYDSERDSFAKLTDVGAGDLGYEVDGLDAAQEYGFRIKAFRRFNGATYWGKRSADYYTVTSPEPVNNLEIPTSSEDALEMRWDKMENASGYQVCRLNTDTGEYEEVAVIEDSGTHFYLDSGLMGASKYSYQVRAYVNYGGVDYWSAFSPETSGMTKPSKVNNLKLATEDSSITLTWDKTARASGYQIYRRDAKTGKYVKIATVNGNQTFSYTDGGLKAGKTYKYKVRAYKRYNGTNYFGSCSKVEKLTAE